MPNISSAAKQAVKSANKNLLSAAGDAAMGGLMNSTVEGFALSVGAGAVVGGIAGADDDKAFSGALKGAVLGAGLYGGVKALGGMADNSEVLSDLSGDLKQAMKTAYTKPLDYSGLEGAEFLSAVQNGLI